MRSSAEAETSGKRWFPYLKGGQFRKWYGNHEHVVNWERGGEEIRGFRDERGARRSRPQNTAYYFKPGITWTFLSASRFSVRSADSGFIFDVAGSVVFPREGLYELLLAFLASGAARTLLEMINPTVNFQVGDIAALPVCLEALLPHREELTAVVREAIALARADWNEQELSWEFEVHPLAGAALTDGFSSSMESYLRRQHMRHERLRELEDRNDALIAAASRSS
jgi:hypothetical protein